MSRSSEKAQSPGLEVELEPQRIAHGGVSVARLDGRVVFVADAIPGERVLARITDDSKPSFWRAETVRVIEPSPHRRPHVWPEAALERDPDDRAGGAEFGHIANEHQRELKAAVLAEALQRFAGIERPTEVEALPGEADGTRWRTRVRLHVDADGTVGPYAARSHRVIRTAGLPLVTAAIEEIAPIREPFAGADTVDVLAPSEGEARLVIGRQAPTAIRERVGGREFRLDDGGFWQVHAAAPETLSAAVRDAVDPDLFDPRAANLDLYGGVGLLAAALGDLAGPALRITSVESDARATEHAAGNLAEWVGARAETARVERWVRGLADAGAAERARLADATVILDPPRSGAGRAVLEALAEVRPAQIVYVACDPVAFARDAGTLAGLGYTLGPLRAFDLFPNTHHVEAVGRFVREGHA
ncbi:TRAM domain-containing protein [Pseudolysinimonas kribbensis]|uniref:23S rRNA methyltransferase n=1 Tax=Pseudolysinimonas kribbensis TaxID=433641 RepID=A0ABQ6K683_9MICO|nr:class I SAM-dependent RNA methyltransferase [Pseudolysinimonas kribbensis]GMA94296.1 23S rRNA methyltransferase [Pseudolysinimonas kribbensis]